MIMRVKIIFDMNISTVIILVHREKYSDIQTYENLFPLPPSAFNNIFINVSIKFIYYIISTIYHSQRIKNKYCYQYY